MSAELLNLLYSFQPEDPELQSNLKYNGAARHFVNQCANVPQQQFNKGAGTSQDILELLNPSVNTIAYIFALHGRISESADPQSPVGIPEQNRPGGSLWNKIVHFLETADPVQLRYVGKEWSKLLEYVEQVARVMATPALAIAPLRSAMFRLDPTTGTFTKTHRYFLRLCVETRSYAAAIPVLDNYIHSLPSNIPATVTALEYSTPSARVMNSGEYITHRSGHSEKITLRDVEEYYVLGAMAYMGVHQYRKARDFLEHVLVVPVGNGVANGLYLEAYKKWVLLSCLVDGSVKAVPRTINANTLKTVKAASKAYDALAEAFTQVNNTAKLKALINAGLDTWAEDGNTGLVKLLPDSQLKFYISRLSRTYSAVPVSNISQNLGGSAEELTGYLSNLIKEGRLNAQLEDTGKPELGVVLRFFLDPTQGPLAKTEKQQQQALFEQTQRTNILAEQVKSADYRISVTKDHVEYVKRMNKKAAAQAGEAMDTSWDDGIVEEDLMGDGL